MTTYRRTPGYCDYCASRIWASRANHFFTRWRCDRCGSRVEVTGEANVRAEEAEQRRRPASPINTDITTRMDGIQEGTFPCWTCESDTLWRKRGERSWFCTNCGTQGRPS